MPTPHKIRFGILGCSRIAQKSVIPAIADSNLAELVMVGSRDKAKAEGYAKQANCPLSGTYEDVLANKDVGVVYISLPNSMHEEWTIKAAEAGKHVWCEKPAALDFRAATRMVAACKKNTVRLMEGFSFLFHPQHKKVLELVEEGTLGEILRFEGCFAYPTPGEGNIRIDPTLGGGVYGDAAVYPIRASRMLFNEEPIGVACALVVDPAFGVDVKVDLLLFYPGGRSALITAAFGGYFQSTYSILGSKAYLKVQRAYAVPKDTEVKILLECDDTVQELAVEPADQFRLMTDDFCQEITQGSASTKQYEEDLLAQARVSAAGYLAHKEKRTVLLSEIE